MSNFHTDTRGRWWSLFKVTCSVVLCGGGTLQTNITEACGQRSQCFSRTGFAPRSRRVCFHVPHFSGSRLLCWELCEAGPGLRALPRFKSLRFRFSGTPQRPRLSWACVLPFPGPSSSGDQVRGERSHPQVWCASYCLPCPSRLVLWMYIGCAFSGLPCVSSAGLISGCEPPGGCQLSRIPGSLG